MSEFFAYDVFLSYSSNDRAVVLEIAERLRADGALVWLDYWEIRPGDSIPAKLEEGLEKSRVLLLCMSGNAFGSEWAQLEACTFRFRDPLNKERRFIPLRLDEAPARGSLGQFAFIDWRPKVRGEEYAKLLDACRQGRKAAPETPARAARTGTAAKAISLGHTGPVRGVAISPDGRRALSASADKIVRLWDVESGRSLRVMEGHTNSVMSVAFSPDGRMAVSGSADTTVRLWDVETGRELRVLEGHSNTVFAVAVSGDGRLVVSGSEDKTLQLWERASGRLLRVLEGHEDSVLSIAFHPDGEQVLSGSADKTLRLWSTKDGHLMRVMEGHTAGVSAVAFSPDVELALSGTADGELGLWDLDGGGPPRFFEGHYVGVNCVAFSPDGRLIATGSYDKTIRLRDTKSGRRVNVLEGHYDSVYGVAFTPDGSQLLSGSADRHVYLWPVEGSSPPREFEGHYDVVWSMAFRPDGSRALSGSADKTVRLWDVESGRMLRVFEGHLASVYTVAFSPDGRLAASGSYDKTTRLWDVEAGSILHILQGHGARVYMVTFSPDGGRVLSASADNTVKLWDVESGRLLRTFEGHGSTVWCVAFSPDGKRALSGSADKTMRLWDVESGRSLAVMEGHTARIVSLAFSPDGSRALSGSEDRTLRVWDVESGHALRVLEGHSTSVWCVAFSPDGSRALSGSDGRSVRMWNVESGRMLGMFRGHFDGVFSVAWSADGCSAFSGAINGVMRVWDLAQELPDEAGVEYTNAKVLLVGDSGAGKTGLSMRLALNEWRTTDSTIGAWATQWKLPVAADKDVDREIWLWDFGGQADQRLIHQLYMEDTALAVLVFDGQKENLFESLGQWDRDLTRASRKPFAKMLAAGRVDAGGLRISRTQLEKFAEERGFARILETSAKTGAGCAELREAILSGIRWEEIPWRSSPLLFKRLKDAILRFKDEGRVLMRFNELRDALRLRLAGEDGQFKDEEVKAVVGLLAGPGVVWELSFGHWVLLQPERINAYAQAVIQTLREDEHERGCVAEERVLKGELSYHSSIERLNWEEERFVLLAMHQTLVERGLCLREHTEHGTLLIFPSYYRRERPELVGHPAVLVSYRFTGFLDDVYATLVVRLHHTRPFTQDQLWRYAADFKTLDGRTLGVRLARLGEGAGELDVYFDPGIALEEKIIFGRYVHEHLMEKARDVVRLRHYVCPHCGEPAGNREIARRKLAEGKQDMPCVNCDDSSKRIPLWDRMEELFTSEETKQLVREMREQADLALDIESRDRALVGEVISTVSLAGQTVREYNVSDHGIDMEIEFRDDDGEATGRKLYLILKASASFIRELRQVDVEVYKLREESDAQYWMARRAPVLLVVRGTDGVTQWMEVGELFQQAGPGGRQLKELVFEGERLDVLSVRQWRDLA